MRHIFIFTIALFVFGSSSSNAQDDTRLTLLKAQTTINEAYLTQNPVLLDETISMLNEQVIEESDYLQKFIHYYRGLAYFRMFPLPMTEDSDLFSDNLDKAQKELEKAVGIDPDFDEAYSVLGGVYGMKAAGMFSGMKYGGKAKRAMEKARELSPENPRTYLIDGIGDYYKPKLFGGGLDNALEAFTKAAELFETFESKSVAAPNWGKAEVQAWLGLINLDLGNTELAIQNFSNAVDIEPDFKWAADELSKLVN